MNNELVKKLRMHAEIYSQHPYGGEVSGTDKLLLKAAKIIEELSEALQSMNVEGTEEIN